MGETIYRHPAFEKAMNEHFDATDNETRKVLLAVNEEDQNRVLTALTSKLYDSVVDKVDDIDFGEIPATKGDITKLPSYERTIETAHTIQDIMKQFNQDTSKNVDQILIGIENIATRRELFKKGYLTNMELPIIMYNVMVMNVVKSLSFMISNCIDYIKSPDTDSFDAVVNRNGVIKTDHHVLFDNLRRFNESCRTGEFDKAMDYVIKTGSKQFLGGALIVGQSIALIGIVLNIVPISRELVYFYYYNRVRLSDYFALQADLLQINAYDVQHNRPDISKEERDKIAKKQLTVVNAFRSVSEKIAIDCKKAERSSTKDLVAQSKKYKTSEIMDDVPDSAAASIF